MADAAKEGRGVAVEVATPGVAATHTTGRPRRELRGSLRVQARELDKRFHLLRRGDRVLDLGACPGSWSQYALRRVGAGGLLVSVDLQPITTALPGAIVLQEDVFALEPEPSRT